MANASTNTAVINAPSRKIFAPMFRARWQNMQNIVNDSAIIDLIPEPYLTYYTAFVRQCLQWSRGFVPSLHRQDFFSTGLGYTVCEVITRETMGGGYRLQAKDEAAQRFIEDWQDKMHLSDELFRMFFFTASGGNAIMAITPVDGEAYLSAYPIDRVIFSINRRGDIVRATIFNRFTCGETTYFARERRTILNGKGYYMVEIGCSGQATTPDFNGGKAKAIPKEIQWQFEYTYGDIEINTWYALPDGISGCGLYNIKNKPVCSAGSDLPGYSDSSLYTALDILYSIDYNYTQAQVDMYKGKSIVLIPKQMASATINTGRVNTANGVSFSEAIQEPQLKDDFYTEVMTANGEPIQPHFIQADLRGQQHKQIRDADLELLASKVGLSASTLANHLAVHSAKTATQVVDEQSTTETTVNSKRELARAPINQMLTDIIHFYGFSDDVELEWGRPVQNSTTVNRELLEAYNAGVLPLKKYLRKRWNDLDEEEIEQWAAEIKAEQAEKQEQVSKAENLYKNRDFIDDYMQAKEKPEKDKESE